MDDATTAWLLAQLRPATDPAELQARYQRLQSACAVALALGMANESLPPGVPGDVE
ncbi:hypothetical protein ACFWIQ_27615 [Kitasatospora sp. NPDC127059]|uniref:hypothetical protein n=1 Tax=unclassified Kitasatospora TaxID=2633591 RepID=UPI0036659C2B